MHFSYSRTGLILRCTASFQIVSEKRFWFRIVWATCLSCLGEWAPDNAKEWFFILLQSLSNFCPAERVYVLVKHVLLMFQVTRRYIWTVLTIIWCKFHLSFHPDRFFLYLFYSWSQRLAFLLNVALIRKDSAIQWQSKSLCSRIFLCL